MWLKKHQHHTPLPVPREILSAHLESTLANALKKNYYPPERDAWACGVHRSPNCGGPKGGSPGPPWPGPAPCCGGGTSGSAPGPRRPASPPPPRGPAARGCPASPAEACGRGGGPVVQLGDGATSCMHGKAEGTATPSKLTWKRLWDEIQNGWNPDEGQINSDFIKNFRSFFPHAIRFAWSAEMAFLTTVSHVRNLIWHCSQGLSFPAVGGSSSSVGRGGLCRCDALRPVT